MGQVKSSTDSKLEVSKFLDIQYIHPGNASDLEKEIVGAINVLIKDYKERYSIE